MTGKRTLPPILAFDYFRNAVLPWAAVLAACALIANAILFASIMIG